MKATRNILMNPLGWAITIVHWIVAAFAFLGDIPVHPPGFGTHATTELMFILAMLDLPALMITKGLFSPFESPVSITLTNMAIPIGLITLQWLLVGAVVSRMYSDYRSTVALNDDSGLNLD